MITSRELKNGKVINYQNALYSVVESQHHKPGKGAAFVRVKLRSVDTGLISDRTFRPEEKFEEVFIDERRLLFLYRDGDIYHFMDQENYEQLHLTREFLGEKINFLKENEEVTASFSKGKIIDVTPPLFVKMKISYTEPGIKGDTARGGSKPATLESGAVVQVPLFVNKGDTVKIDTRTGEYVERA
jgi:elongation factor P